MVELTQSVRLKYDGSGVVGQVAGTKKALDEVADSARKLGPAGLTMTASPPIPVCYRWRC